MIAKHVPMRTVDKSDFGDLVDYLTDEQAKQERLGAVTVTNCHSDDHRIAIVEVRNTQAQNTRAESDKTYHLIVSFRAGEQPDAETLRAIEARICDALGYGEHQRISAVHHDTDNLHVHIAINKIHPTRYTIHDPYNDHKTLGHQCEVLEREYGLEIDNHQAQKTGAENRAGDMERHAGVESLLGWIKRECANELHAAQTWAELHTILGLNGLEMHHRGNGLVLSDADGLTVKASSVARDLSKAALEKRLGPFEPSSSMGEGGQGGEPTVRAPRRRYAPKPMRSRVDTTQLYAAHRLAQASAYELRKTEWAKAVDRKSRLIEDAKRSGRLKRAAIKLLKGPGVSKPALYGIVSRTLRAEIAEINKQYLAERQAIHETSQRQTWADWLRAKATEGDAEALRALRAREAAQGLKGNTMSGAGRRRAGQGAAVQDGVTKKGTIIYRAGATAVRDDGARLSVSRGATQDGLQAALRMAMERYGDRLSVNGSAAFKEQLAQAAAAARLDITFDDGALELRRRELLTLKPTTEKPHEHRHATTAGGRTDSRSDRNGRGDTSSGAARDGQAAAGARVPGAGLAGKPNIGRVGRKPPPQSQNRLRGLSELGVVRDAGGSQMLLPGHVSGHMEQQGAQPDHKLRRDVSRPGRVSVAGQAAADRYIAEREALRSKVNDIPKHGRYTATAGSAFAFAGVRQVEGQTLALLKWGDDIMVLPIDAATTRRLQRVAIGQTVNVTPKGSVKTKDRSR